MIVDVFKSIILSKRLLYGTFEKSKPLFVWYFSCASVILFIIYSLKGDILSMRVTPPPLFWYAVFRGVLDGTQYAKGWYACSTQKFCYIVRRHQFLL